MATDKKSVLLYCDLIHTVEKLDDETAGKLFKHYLRYVNDLEPETDDIMVDVVFEPIKQNLKRDLKKWEGTKSERSDAGFLGNLKRWHLDLYNKVISKELTINEVKEIVKHRKASLSDDSDSYQSLPIANIAVKDTVIVTVTDKVIVKDIKKKEKKSFNFRKSLVELGVKEDLSLGYVELRNKKRAANTQAAFNLLKNKIEKSKFGADKIIETLIERNWLSFEDDWISNITNKTNQNGATTTKKAAVFNYKQALSRFAIPNSDSVQQTED